MSNAPVRVHQPVKSSTFLLYVLGRILGARGGASPRSGPGGGASGPPQLLQLPCGLCAKQVPHQGHSTESLSKGDVPEELIAVVIQMGKRVEFESQTNVGEYLKYPHAVFEGTAYY